MTDRYSYDAFGNSISQSGGTPNIYRYQGEAFDAITGLVYLRSRHLSNSNGRFLAADTYAFSLFDPINIHRYIYAQDNPINRVDQWEFFFSPQLSESIGICKSWPDSKFLCANGRKRWGSIGWDESLHEAGVRVSTKSAGHA